MSVYYGLVWWTNDAAVRTTLVSLLPKASLKTHRIRLSAGIQAIQAGSASKQVRVLGPLPHPMPDHRTIDPCVVLSLAERGEVE